MLQLGVVIEFGTMGEATCPSKDGGDGVCGGFFALLMLAIMAGDGAMGRFRFNDRPIWGHKNRGHQAERAKALRDDFHGYALDLRGHGNSAWAPGALYSIAEHVLDLSALADIIHRFQTNAEPRVLVMQPQASAHGITLTAADTVIFCGPLMSVELYVQAIARSDRKGQTSDKVTVVHIQSSPIEKKMFAAMDSKVNDHTLLTEMFDEEMKETVPMKK